MKRFILLTIFCILALVLYAQSISVSSFKLLETDLTANTAGTMETDQNGEVAALIKVVTTQTGFTFDGGSLGIVKTKQTPGEVWVYIPRSSKKISIKHPQLGVLRDFYFPCSIDAARTYEMKLTTGTIETTVHQARNSQYVVFQMIPSNAVVELNGEQLETNDGTATKYLKFGTYNYRVNAPNYLPEAGNVIINNPENKHIINISLKPNFSQVTLTVDNDAEIWVNGEQKGIGSWTGNLGAGTYEFETRKRNHRSIVITKDINYSAEPQLINLQAPIPLYGEVDINSSPAMADIFLDGKIVGQTPLRSSNILIGDHQLRIYKKGYKEYVSTLLIKESEICQISTILIADTIRNSILDNSKKEVDEHVIINFMCNTNAGLIIDGKFVGPISTEKTQYKLPIGRHTISVKNASFFDYEKEVNISKEETIDIHLIEPDWQSVQITRDENLVRYKTLIGKIGILGLQNNVTYRSARCRAKKMGGSIVLIKKENGVGPLEEYEVY